jgi:hypothetical protein
MTKSREWLLNRNLDFLFIHAGAGALTLPFLFLAQHCPQAFPIVYSCHIIFISRPHMAATWARFLDLECRRFRFSLGVVAPIAIAMVFGLGILWLNSLSVAVLTWLFGMVWHYSRQNFGIFRSYVSLRGANSGALVNRSAEVVINLAPFSILLSSLCYKCPHTFLSYDLASLPIAVLMPITVGACALSAVALLVYLASEFREARLNQFLPGRFLCVSTAIVVNLVAWVAVSEMMWGYLMAGFLHGLQYLSFVAAFRKQPPAWAHLAQTNPWLYIATLAIISLALQFSYNGFAKLVVLFPIFHLTMSFHHYLVDAFVWKRPRRDHGRQPDRQLAPLGERDAQPIGAK